MCGERGEFWSVWPGGEGGGADRRGKRELGEGARTDAGAGGGRGIASLSERNNVERAKEGDSHREGVRVFGQQPPGVWSLSNTRDILGSSCVCVCGGGWGSLVFRGYVLWGFSVIQWGWDLEGKDIITIFVQQS